MRALLAFASVLMAGCASDGADEVVAGRIAYVNGQIFDGRKFQPAPLVVQDGRFVEAKVETSASIVDLQGGHVVPPFCEAHNHNLGSADENEEAIAAYLREGIFYVGILSNLPRLTDEVRHTYNSPASVDVIFANGPLTASGGHPIRLREFLLDRGNYPGFTRETLPGQGYFVIDDEADLERLWPEILRLRPDVVKIILQDSQEFERRRDDPAFFGQKGLDPALAPLIVERAHAAGLRVFAHIGSAEDFHVAVEAGADVIAHLPARDGPSPIDPADARAAAKRGVRLITTAVLIEQPRRRDNAKLYATVKASQIENLRTLRDAGVTLVVGSDDPRTTSTPEVQHLRGLGLFGNADLLRMWSTDCARTLFPERRLGALQPGYEASFLVLDGDPLADFDATGNIRLRVKDGEAINIPESGE